MPNVIDDPAIVEEIDYQHDAITTDPTTSPLPTPQRRRFHLLAALRSTIASCMRRRIPQSPRILPCNERFEAPVDILARHHTYLYIRSLSG